MRTIIRKQFCQGQSPREFKVAQVAYDQGQHEAISVNGTRHVFTKQTQTTQYCGQIKPNSKQFSLHKRLAFISYTFRVRIFRFDDNKGREKDIRALLLLPIKSNISTQQWKSSFLIPLGMVNSSYKRTRSKIKLTQK